MQIEYTIVLGVFGIIFGSAINAVVWRLYVRRSWARGRSVCPDCDHELAARDLVPVLSWLWLRGHCRYCQAKIHVQYPLVELLTGLVFGLSAYALVPTNTLTAVRLAFWLMIVLLLIVLGVYDARWLLLPDKVMMPTIAVALIYTVCMTLIAHDSRVLVGPFLAASAAAAAFLLLVVFTRGRAMGGGDIKLVFVMGLLLGVRNMAVALFIAFNVAAIYAIALIIARKRGRGDQIPFGPFLVAGTFVAFLYGHQLIDWYLTLNGIR